jgi:wyosine [tRNA(Phe)-imidazoG37] synthetase (radical SAM superfamily)
MAPERRRHTFGPVPSRRLGRSLGVDLVPMKTCTLDCVYCQLQATSRHTLERRRFVDPARVLDEVRAVCEAGTPVDTLTLSGSGEPTLSADLGTVLRGLADISPARRAVLTNGTLLSRTDVRQELAAADLVMPSLDAVTEAAFKAVNRPAPGLTLHDHLRGLEAFCAAHPGEIWLEILLVAGLNDDEDHLAALAAYLPRLRVDRVQLNTVVRTPTERSLAHPVPAARMETIRERLSTIHPSVEIIGRFEGAREGAGSARTIRTEEALAALERRPCRADELAASLGAAPEEVARLLEGLLGEGHVRRDEGGFYFVEIEA